MSQLPIDPRISRVAEPDVAGALPWADITPSQTQPTFSVEPGPPPIHRITADVQVDYTQFGYLFH